MAAGDILRFQKPNTIRNPISEEDVDDNFNALTRKLNELIDMLNALLGTQPSWRPPSYDSGILDVPDTLTDVQEVTTWVYAIVLYNTSGQIRHLTVTDGDDEAYMTEAIVPASKLPLTLELHAAAFQNGIKWQVKSGQTGLRAQIVGEQ